MLNGMGRTREKQLREPDRRRPQSSCARTAKTMAPNLVDFLNR